MYRRSSHEPRYKQSTRARELRHAESNEFSDVSSSSSEEEEESSDRCTEETEENSVVSQECQSYQERLKGLDRSNRPTKRSSYLPDSKDSKKDKFTQKNFLSPFPSDWAQPEKREVVGTTYYKVSKTMPVKEQYSFQADEKSPKASTKKRESHKDNDELTKKSPEETEKKMEKHKLEKESHPLKIIETKQAGKYNHRETSGKFLGPLVEDLTRNFGAKASSRRPKTSQEIELSNQISENCAECAVIATNRSKSKRKSGVGTASTEKDQKSQDIVFSKDIGDGKPVKNKCKEVKEKLVYVVEEEGKDATKTETDIFSLSEILAIKKDLIELSEFAKKLKKVKELKKDTECDQIKKNSCHCQPAEELLRDVNRRIEILETRQEELERKSQSSNRSRDPKAPSKKSNSPPKTPVLVNLSAATTVPSDPKTKILESQVESFACISDIFNELMDIKTQLEKLEKKRILKEVSNETRPQKNANLSKAKDHAIAVFSSKTYILTTENFDKTKNGKAIGEKSRKEMTKENVVNWLKSVSLERTGNDVSVLLSPDAKREENSRDQKERLKEFKCENRTQILKREDFENQEPQKNRASENLQRGVDMSITCFVKNQYTEEPNQFVEQKKCMMTSSGKFITVVPESRENYGKIPRKECDPHPPQVLRPQRTMPKIVHRSASNGSIPSTVLIKRQLKKLKSHLTRKKHRNVIKIIRSKSASTIVSKTEKIAENQGMKNSENTESMTNSTVKKPKEGKKEFLKRLEAQFMMLAKNLGMVDPSTTSYSYSELLATVDLETSNSKILPENPNDNHIVMYSATREKGRKSSAKRKHSRKGERRKDGQSIKSYKSEYKKERKKRNMEEKGLRLRDTINENRVPKYKPLPENVRACKRTKKTELYHQNHISDHQHCRSTVVLHPWHPVCKKKSKKQKRFVKDDSFLEERSTTSSTEDSFSESSEECICHPEETPPPSIIKSTTPDKRSRKFNKRSVKKESSNVDQGLIKKFFKNIRRCYPIFCEKELTIAPAKYCPSRQRKCAESESESVKRCCHPKNRVPSQRLVHNRIEFSPSLDTEQRRKLHFQGTKDYCSPHRPRHHSRDTHHHRKHSRRSHRAHKSREPHSKRAHHSKTSEKSFVGRCECEFVKPFIENKDLSSLSSFKPFELLENENKSKKKANKCKKNDSEFPQLNHQVYLLNPTSDDFRKRSKTLSCFCNKCGNVHRRQHKFVYTLIDQKAVNHKSKCPSHRDALQEGFEDEYRGQYDNYDDYNCDNYDRNDLDSKSDQLDNHKSGHYDDLKSCRKGSDCEGYKVNSKKNHYNEYKTDNYTDSTSRFNDSTKSKNSSKKDETFPFFSFFRQICRLKSQKTTGCQCEGKIEKLETRINEMEKDLFSRPPRASKPSSHKRKSRSPRRRNSKRLKEKKLEKEFENTTCTCNRDEIERRRRTPEDLKNRKKLKEKDIRSTRNREAAALYYAINTPSLVLSTSSLLAQDKKLFQAKSSFPFHKRINDGLSSLHSCWLNLRNHKFNSMRNLMSKMRRKSVTSSNYLIDDSSKSNQIPRRQQVVELKNEPTNFLTKHIKSKKKTKKKRKEKAVTKTKSRKRRYK